MKKRAFTAEFFYELLATCAIHPAQSLRARGIRIFSNLSAGHE
ncbi:hypothetical protein [Sneathiella sp.]|nr:hypothetical protein [Sneathiella sp.]MDF2366480.1 hypothetical protein [Sneathiella sp.]